MAVLFTHTPSLKKAIGVMNDLDSSKFPLLLNRISQTLQSSIPNQQPFSKEEEQKLQLSLGLDGETLSLLLESVTFIFQQAAYHTAKPPIIQQQLQLLELNEDKVSAFVQSWTSSAKGIVDCLRQRSLFPNQLENVTWSLNVGMSSSTQKQQKKPLALFQFDMNNESTKDNEKLTVEFDHSQLYQFYNQLENIQSQLDALK